MNPALKRRIAPSTPLTLEFMEEGNIKTALKFKLAFDFNAAAAIQEKTDLNLLDFSIWKNANDPNVMRVMFWAATHAHHPEYRSDEALEVLGSYMDESNSGQIYEALWAAYLAYLPKQKREYLERLRKTTDEVTEEMRQQGETNPMKLGQEIIRRMSLGSTSGPSPDTTSASATASSAA